MPPSFGAPLTQPSGTQALTPEVRAHQLAQQLVQARQDLVSLQADLRNVRSERDALRAELSRAKAQWEELTAAAGAKPVPEPPPPALDPDLELKLRGRINELEAALSKARSSSQPPPPPSEDLKQVRGIGPKFEKLLRADGVTGIAQIAAWSESEVDEIARRMGVNPERIRREDWVGSAKLLLASR